MLDCTEQVTAGSTVSSRACMVSLFVARMPVFGSRHREFGWSCVRLGGPLHPDGCGADRRRGPPDGQGATFWHGFTYNGHPVGAAVSLANLDIIEREGLLERAKYIGDLMLSALAPLSDLPGVVEVRGAGLALGIEFDGVDAASIAQLCRQDGVIVRAGIGRIVLSPSLVITEAQAYAICTALEKHIRTATNS